MMRALSLTAAALLLGGCGATPTPADPCAEGRCGSSPVAPSPEAPAGKPARGLEDESEVQAWVCRELPQDGAGQPRTQCRLRWGPFRFAVTDGPNGTVLSTLNNDAQPLETPKRTPVEGQRTFDGHR